VTRRPNNKPMEGVAAKAVWLQSAQQGPLHEVTILACLDLAPSARRVPGLEASKGGPYPLVRLHRDLIPIQPHSHLTGWISHHEHTKASGKIRIV
jgi:hypothetical protein